MSMNCIELRVLGAGKSKHLDSPLAKPAAPSLAEPRGLLYKINGTHKTSTKYSICRSVTVWLIDTNIGETGLGKG